MLLSVERKGLEPLDLELEMVVSWHVGAGNKLWSDARAAGHLPLDQLLIFIFCIIVCGILFPVHIKSKNHLLLLCL